MATIEMELQYFIDHVQDLSDLELAMLLGLIANQHFLVETPDDLIDDLASELALVSIRLHLPPSGARLRHLYRLPQMYLVFRTRFCPQTTMSPSTHLDKRSWSKHRAMLLTIQRNIRMMM